MLDAIDTARGDRFGVVTRVARERGHQAAAASNPQQDRAADRLVLRVPAERLMPARPATACGSVSGL
jgi:hypothetical protein